MRSFLVVLVVFLCIPCFALADSHMFNTKAGELDVNLSFHKAPFVGENMATIKLTGADGATISNAKVKVDYGMPAVKNMAPMHYKAWAKQKDGAYMLNVNLNMEGPWFINLRILEPGKKIVKVSFKLAVGGMSGMDHDQMKGM